MFGNLFKVVVGVATLPVAVVADAVTLGGTLTDKNESYTGRVLESVEENVEKVLDPNE